MFERETLDGLLPATFSGPNEFAKAIRAALACAAREGWPSMVWSDASFEDWPLGERVVIESLQAWAGKGRHLLILAHRYDSILKYKPRFVGWRKTWDHIIECRVCKTVDYSEMPSALWSPSWALRRLDPVRCTGLAGLEPQQRVSLKEDLDECQRQSSPGFSVTTLGL
jgi:hypothetical protein